MRLKIGVLVAVLLISFGLGLYYYQPQEQGDFTGKNRQGTGFRLRPGPRGDGGIAAGGEPVDDGGSEQAGKSYYYRDRVAILMYHHIDTRESTATISPGRFTAQLDKLGELGYNFISLEQAAAFLDGQGQVPANAVVVTFDDGYDSFYRYAYPALKSRNIPAAMFVIVGHVGKNKGEIPKLTWAEMQEMQRDGYTFYSHTYDSHKYVPVSAKGAERPALAGRVYRAVYGRETLAEFRRRIQEDLHKSKELLEQNLGRKVEFLALPYGAAGKDSINIAQQLGFKYILSTEAGLNDANTSKTHLLRFNGGSPKLDGMAIHREIMGHL